MIQKQNTLSDEKQALVDKIQSLLPGVEKPTILPLAHDEKNVALHMVSKENLFWETMETLKEEGASSILVLPIEKMLKWVKNANNKF